MDHKWLLRNKDIQCDKEEFGKNDRKPAMENKICVDVLPEFIWPPVLSCVCSFKSHQRLSMHKWICHSSIRESIRITSSSLFFPCIQSCLLPSILLFFLIRHNHRPTQFSAAFIISKIEAKYVIRADAHVARKRVFKHNITAFVYTWRCLKGSWQQVWFFYELILWFFFLYLPSMANKLGTLMWIVFSFAPYKLPYRKALTVFVGWAQRFSKCGWGTTTVMVYMIPLAFLWKNHC